MTDIILQPLTGKEKTAFVDEEDFSAVAKQDLLEAWRHFISGGFKKLFFTRSLYRFLYSHSNFTRHSNQDAFWTYYFNTEVGRLRAFLNQFGGNGRSAEFGTTAWLDGSAADLKQAMVGAMTRLYAPLLQVLEDLEIKHAELGQVWREFALAGNLPDPGYPPHYLVSENTRHLLAYAAHIALHKPHPLLGLQQQFPLFSAAENGLYISTAQK